MRITFRALDDGLAAINAAAEQYTRAQNEVATGKRVRAASDDPGAALRIIEGRTEIGTLDAYTRSADTAGARLTVLDTLFTDIVDKLTEAKATAANARGTTASDVAREAIAAKLQGIRDGLLSDFNTTFRGTYLFSGGKAQSQPFAQVAGVWTYGGDHSSVTVDVGRSRTVTIAMDGHGLAQGGDATDLFAEFDAMIAAVQASDDQGVSTGMDALDRTFDRVVRAQSLTGVDEQGIEEEQVRSSSFRLASLKRVSSDEDANMAEAITRMTQAQTAYQAALGAVGTASKVSLLDYLR